MTGLLSLLLALVAGGTAGWCWRDHRGRRQRRHDDLQTLPPRQLRDWLEQLPQGWLVVAPDGRLASLNRRAEGLLNLQQPLALLGQPLQALDPGEDVLHLVALARDKGLIQRGSWIHHDDTLEMRVLPGRDGWVALLLEGRNPLQRQLQRQEAWVSDVAHELRTPITALMLVADSLATRLEGGPLLLVERLQKELRRLQELVNDLLVLSRLENTPMVEGRRPSAIDPRDVLGSVWALLAPLAEPRGVRLQISPGRDQARLAAVEASRLHQALFNLLDNALRYSPDGGVVAVSIDERDRWCLIGVRDGGPGLSDTDQRRLFERFYRGDPSRAREARAGSGLGLAIVQQIALSQGGLVRARNHPEGGALLELLLPRA